MGFEETLERLYAKSQYHHFDLGDVLNMTIYQAYDKEGKRDFSKEDFVFKDNPMYKDWLETFIDDIHQMKVDMDCPYFWERWDYCQKNPVIIPEHRFYQIVVSRVKKQESEWCSVHRRNANQRKGGKKRQRVNQLRREIESELPIKIDAHLAKETEIDIIYNALLLELSTEAKLTKNDDISLGSMIEYYYEHQEGNSRSQYFPEVYTTIGKFYQCVQALKTFVNKPLSVNDILAIYQILVPNGAMRTTDEYLWCGKIHRKKLPDDFLHIWVNVYHDKLSRLGKKSPVAIIAWLFKMLIEYKPFYQYNEMLAIAILNLELKKHGLPMVSIRRRDIFFIENLPKSYYQQDEMFVENRYYLYESKPQTYVELVLQYVLNEIHYLQENAIQPNRNNPFLYGEPTTEITDEHFHWWENLPKLWQRILLIALYHPEKLEPKIDMAELEYAGDVADVGYYLDYPIPDKITADELARMFELTMIAYNRGDVNPKLYTVVEIIPPLHYFKQLQYLSLTENYITDYSGLQGLTKLKHLNLHENCNDEDEQLKYIATLTSLEYLDLSVNYFDDLSPLSTLVNLKFLSQWGGVDKPVNITSFEQLQKLEHLHFGVPKDITPLASLQNLKELEFGTDEFDFDCSKIEWLMQELPNCKIDYDLPCIGMYDCMEVSDETFLWKILLEGHRFNRFFGSFDKQRLFDLYEKYQHSDDVAMKNLTKRAMQDYVERWKENVPY